MWARSFRVTPTEAIALYCSSCMLVWQVMDFRWQRRDLREGYVIAEVSIAERLFRLLMAPLFVPLILLMFFIAFVAWRLK